MGGTLLGPLNEESIVFDEVPCQFLLAGKSLFSLGRPDTGSWGGVNGVGEGYELAQKKGPDFYRGGPRLSYILQYRCPSRESPPSAQVGHHETGWGLLYTGRSAK